MGSMRFDRRRRARLNGHAGLAVGSVRLVSCGPVTDPSTAVRPLRHMGWISPESYAEACADPAVREMIASARAMRVPRVEGPVEGDG
jgi:hypothetical protein